jgi:hypothetical protein
MASRETEEGEVVLLTIEHDSFSTIRLVNANQAVVSNGNTFQAFAFKATLPEETDRVKSAKLVVDNTDRRLVTSLRSIQSPAKVTMQVVLFSQPDTIDLEVGPLRLEKANISLNEIELPLGAEPVAYQPVPHGKFTPNHFPGLF